MTTYQYDTPWLFIPFHLTEAAFEAVKAQYRSDDTTAKRLYAENGMDLLVQSNVSTAIRYIYSRMTDRMPLERFVCNALELDHLNMELELGDCLENHWAHNTGHLSFDICRETDKSLIYSHWVITTLDGKTANVVMYEERRKKSDEDKPTGKVNKVQLSHSTYTEVRGTLKVCQNYLSKTDLLNVFHESKSAKNSAAWVSDLKFSFAGAQATSNGEFFIGDCLNAIEQLPWWKPSFRNPIKPKLVGKLSKGIDDAKSANRVGKRYLVNQVDGNALTVVDWPLMAQSERVLVVAGTNKMPGPCDLVDMVVTEGEGVII